ncbi:hypothetical protein QBC35DRAFT_476078 [Podospora australis]|uniref:Apple domain-containing protein n=1 Tax=Podospora australis TaxID=1536484 RepID=A0AAN7AH42_9PEZI|nr:hypothetical protein QBC35DRAFT_476078 [Podospora australis]
MTDPSRQQGSQLRAVNNLNSNDHNNQRVRFAEDDSNPARQAQPSPAPPPGPAVYWDDQESVTPGRENDRESVAGTANTANLAHYTFYREPTPPPYEPQEKAVGGGYGAYVPGGTAGGSSAGGGAESEAHLRPVGSAPGGQQSTWSHADSDEEMSPAAKKRAVWIIIIVGIVVLVGIAVGVGVGLTVGMRSKSSTPAEPQEQTPSSLPITAIGPSPTPTSSATLGHNDLTSHSLSTTLTHTLSTTSTTVSPIPTLPVITNSDCPASNNTIYGIPSSTKSFLRLCGIDYSGNGAKDLAHVYTESMAECMHACASFDQCTACGWGYQEGDAPGKDYRCYMKTNLKASHQARKDWCFAILQ